MEYPLLETISLASLLLCNLEMTLTDGFRVRERDLVKRITDVSGYFLIFGL